MAVATHIDPAYIAELNQSHLHHDEHWERESLLKQLDHIRLSPGEKDRIIHCGDNAWLQRSQSTGRFRIAANTCRSRLCPRCRSRAAALTRDRITAAMTTAENVTWRLITLTLRSASSDLNGQLHNLTRSFRRLRQSKWWRTCVQGGYAVIELTRNAETGLWHPHVHVIAASSFILKSRLSDAWKRASRGSFIVDIKLVRQPEKAAAYIAKYLGKPSLAILNAPAHVLNEYLDLTHRHRMFVKFGSVNPLPPKETVWPDPKDWTPYQPLHIVILAAQDGDQWAVAVLAALEKHDDGTDPTDPHSE